jgi:hypothetical protein
MNSVNDIPSSDSSQISDEETNRSRESDCIIRDETPKKLITINDTDDDE